MSPVSIYMCENCKDVRFDYRGKSHTTLECPFLKIAYCGLCSKRGHFHTECPDTASLSSRRPEFVEQLIPPSLRERYHIETSCTPLPNREPLPAKIPPSMWEIPKKDADALKKFLEDHKAQLEALNLKIKQNKEHNEAILYKLADSQKKIVVWVTKSGKQAEKDEDQTHQTPQSAQPKTAKKNTKKTAQA
jgi:hypothetical protein